MLSFQLYVNEGEDEREGWTEILEVSRKRKKSFEGKLLDLKAYEKIKVHIGVKYLCYVRAVACTRYYRSNNESSASKCFFFHLSFIKNEQDFPFFLNKTWPILLLNSEKTMIVEVSIFSIIQEKRQNRNITFLHQTYIFSDVMYEYQFVIA